MPCGEGYHARAWLLDELRAEGIEANLERGVFRVRTTQKALAVVVVVLLWYPPVRQVAIDLGPPFPLVHLVVKWSLTVWVVWWLRRPKTPETLNLR
jgi:hypothetical protein